MKGKELSLEDWPTEPPGQQCYRLSPLSERILKTTKIDYHELLPITWQEFAESGEAKGVSQYDVEELYHEEMLIRQRRVGLLRSLWEKMNKRCKVLERNSSTMVSKKLTACKSTRAKDKSPHHKSKSKSPSPIIFKAKSRKKLPNNEYFNDYNYKLKHNSHTDESTKSKPHQKEIPNDEYFQTTAKIRKRKGKQKMKEKSQLMEKATKDKQELVEELSNLINRWTDLYDKHMQEQAEAVNFPEKEKKRLDKMQEVEKQELKQQIEELNRKVGDQVGRGKCK